MAIPAGSFRQGANIGVQINNEAAAAQGLPVGFKQNRSATGSQHQILFTGELVDSRGFPFTETRFAFDLENQGNAGAGEFFNRMIGVEKIHVQKFSKMTPNGGFADAHRSNQKNVTRHTARYASIRRRNQLN